MVQYRKNTKKEPRKTARWVIIISLVLLLSAVVYASAETLLPAYEETYTTTWDTSTVKVGPHVIEATAYDEAGNSSTDTITVEVVGTGTNLTSLTLNASKKDLYLDTTTNSSLLRGNLFKADGVTELAASPVYVKKFIDGEWTFAGSDETTKTSVAVYASIARNYQFRVAPVRTTQYKYVYYGNSFWQNSESPTLTVKVWEEVK